MRIGRTGVFKTATDKVGAAAVVAITSAETLVAKEVNTGSLIRFNRGEFHCFNSCGMNPEAANVVRQATGVQEASYGYGSGRSLGYNEYDPEPEGTIALADFDFQTNEGSLNFDFALGVKQIRNKKRVTALPAAIAAFLRPFIRKAETKKGSRKASRKASVRK